MRFFSDLVESNLSEVLGGLGGFECFLIVCLNICWAQIKFVVSLLQSVLENTSGVFPVWKSRLRCQHVLGGYLDEEISGDPPVLLSDGFRSFLVWGNDGVFPVAVCGDALEPDGDWLCGFFLAKFFD